jgi:hypothetical protein
LLLLVLTNPSRTFAGALSQLSALSLMAFHVGVASLHTVDQANRADAAVGAFDYCGLG